jgi:nucleoside triphosphate diphosphatase
MVEFLRVHCPWDAAQTPRSLLPYLLEEAHEVAEAVELRDDPGLAAELGDLLLHVAFQISLARERDAFDADDIASAVIAKMRRRHPQLFGMAPAGSAAGSSPEWERLKAVERGDASLVSGLAPGLDPLSRAHRLQERVSAVGFDWADASGALAKVREEVEEVAMALAEGPEPRIEEELGDLLFSVVNLARLAGSHGMHALARANRKFSDRFRGLERLAAERGIDLGGAGLEQLDALWDEVKARAEPTPPGSE